MGMKAGGDNESADLPMRHPIVGIMGGSNCPKSLYEETRQIAGELAKAGVTVLCGGGVGVMEAAARGASEAGGLTVGIMPGSRPEESPPNRWIQIPIYTGLSDARNAVNVRSADVVLAVGGAYGTLSEIALALKIGKPAVLFRSWDLPAPPVGSIGDIQEAKSPREAVQMVLQRLNG